MIELLRVLPKTEKLRRDPILSVGVALALTCIALLLTRLMWSAVSDSKFLFFFAAIVVTAWLGGFIPGLAATVLSVLAADYLLPSAQGILGNATELLQVLMFILVASLVSWIEHQRLTSEANLSQSNARLQAIIANLSDGVTVQDASGNVLVANDAAAKLAGWSSPAEMMQTQIGVMQHRANLLNFDGTPFQYENLPRNRAFRDGVASSASFRIQFVDTGEEHWIEVKSAPIRDADGRVELAVSIFRDIQPTKRYEQAINDERAHLRRLLDNIVAFVGVLTPDGVLIEANAPALQAVAIPEAELFGKHLADVMPFAYAPQVQGQLRAAIESARAGKLARYDVQVQVANQQLITIDFMIAPLFAADGKIDYLIASGFDISDRRRKEEQLAHMTMLLDGQRLRLKRIMNAIPAIVFEITANGQDGHAKAEFINDYAEIMLGYPIALWRGDPQFGGKIIHPDDLQPLLELATEIYTKEKSGTMQYRYIAQDGRTVYAEAHMDVIRDNMKNPLGACGVVLDITDRKQAELALARQADELRRSNAELEQFAYVASHDLQEPLRMVTSYLQLLEQRYGDRFDGEAREFMDFAVDGANRMKKLIQDLLAYSRVQRSRKPFTTVDLDHVLEQALQNLQIPIAESSAQVSNGTMPTVVGNEGLLTQLLQNLVGNAIKFRRDEPPLIKIDHELRGREWIISVRDNGIGIEQKYLSRVFDIFQRFQPASKYPGTGIGLAICRRIVEHHGGRIWLESQVGVGTTFYVALPTAIKAHLDSPSPSGTPRSGEGAGG